MLQDLQQETRERVSEILLKIAKPVVAVKGKLIYAEGAEDPGTGALLVEGSLELRVGTREPFRLEAPDLLGEMQQFDQYGQRTATVTAAEDSVVLKFAWEDFVGVCFSVLSKEQQTEVKDVLAKHAADRLGAGSEESAPGDEPE
jgi:hypothetical protein